MAEVACVYDLTRQPRTATDILPAHDQPRGGDPAKARPAPTAHGKWLTTSVTEDTAQVIGAGFDEATRRDPDQKRAWVALVDGNRHQIDRIRAEARARHLTVPIVVDFVHVIEYLRAAAWCFHPEGDPAAQTWVREHARRILTGHAGITAAAIRRKATTHQLDPDKHRNADRCATYLLNNKRRLDHPTALKQGWPIATGVIDGTCRYLVKDRMDITSAHWSLDGAEAVLKLRALISNTDFEDYRAWHPDQEQQRIHHTRYADGCFRWRVLWPRSRAPGPARRTTSAGSSPVDGRGAFRRFSGELHEEYPHLLASWYAFRDARAARRAVEWLLDNDLVDEDAAQRFWADHPGPGVGRADGHCW